MKVDLPSGIPTEVRFRHRQYRDEEGDPRMVRIISHRYRKPKERYVVGYTQAALYSRGKRIGTAGAFCSQEDKFDYHIGRKQALRHLLESYIPTLRPDNGDSRALRALFWKAFWDKEDEIARRGNGGANQVAGEETGHTEKEREALRKTVTLSFGPDGRGIHPQQAESNPEEERVRGSASLGDEDGAEAGESVVRNASHPE